MILTIGMIVKNEEKYLRQCLEAIVPILRQVDSELIIADTGSTDSTVEIAKAFTENVFHFEWCDDFSAARNATLERARGEWYMSLDADEIFEDVSEIIKLFNSGEFRKYRSATYTVRNYNSENRAIYGDFQAYRLVKITKNTRYVNRIHEYLPQDTPVKKLPALANHYGYLAEDNKENIQKKSQRNLRLLLMELEEDPYSCRFHLEIGQTYSLAGNTKYALEHFTKGLRYAKQQNHELLNPLFADTARILCIMEKYADALIAIKEYFSRKKSRSEIDLQMYFIEAKSYYELGKYKEAILSYEQYIKIFEEYHEGRYHTKDSLHYVVHYTDQYNFRIACMNLVRACISEKDDIAAGRYLKLIPIANWNDDERNIKRRLALELLYLEETENYAQLPALLAQLNENALVSLQPLLEFQLEHETKKALRAEMLTAVQTIRLFHVYADTAGAYATTVYKGEVLTEENLSLLPMHLEVGYYCGLALQALEKEENSRYVEYLKKVLNLYPEWKDVIQILLDELQNSLVKEAKRTESSELEKYASIVKNNINQLIDGGRYEQAAEILKSYEQVYPADPEIAVLKDKLK